MSLYVLSSLSFFDCNFIPFPEQIHCQTVNQLDWQAFHPIFTSCPIWASTPYPVLPLASRWAVLLHQTHTQTPLTAFRYKLLQTWYPYINLLHLVCENLFPYTTNLWFWSPLQMWASNLHPKPPPLLKMIASSPCGPSCVWECVSGGDYTTDRAHSDATKRHREKGLKKQGIRVLEKKERRVSSGMCLRKRGVIPKNWYPHQSCTTDVITVGHTQTGYTTQRTLRVTAGTTGKIHKHTHEKHGTSRECYNLPRNVRMCPFKDTLPITVIVLVLNNDFLTLNLSLQWTF